MGSGGSKKKKKEGGSTKVKVAPAKGKERGSVASDASGADRASIVSEGDGDGNKALFADGQRKRPGTSRSRPATAKAKPKSDGIDIRGVSVSFLKELKIKVEAKKEFLHAEVRCALAFGHGRGRAPPRGVGASGVFGVGPALPGRYRRRRRPCGCCLRLRSDTATHGAPCAPLPTAGAAFARPPRMVSQR